MPIFEYHCQECNATFERLVLRPQAETVTLCPQCNSVHTMKLFSTFCAQGGTTASTGGTSNLGFR
jgi:putative FmdB family regulatory protein